MVARSQRLLITPALAFGNEPRRNERQKFKLFPAICDLPILCVEFRPGRQGNVRVPIVVAPLCIVRKEQCTTKCLIYLRVRKARDLEIDSTRTALDQVWTGFATNWQRSGP